jgi:hypothetical protein
MVVIGGQMVVLLVVALVVETSHHLAIGSIAHSGCQPSAATARRASAARSVPRL